MPREFFSVAEILAAGSSALPSDKGGLSRLVDERGWRNDEAHAHLRPGVGREGGTWEYHLSLFPSEVRARLIAGEIASDTPQSRIEAASQVLWSRFENLPDRLKDEARTRLARVEQANTLSAAMSRQAAVALVATEAKISTSTLWGWLRLVAERPARDHLPALAPRYSGRSKTADCDPRAWDFLVADYLRPEQPSFDACHRRMSEAATANGWSPLPSKKTLSRKLERQIPRTARVIARKGMQAAKAIYPHQTRDKSTLTALEAVNADGHRFDVFVKWADGEIGRPMMTAFQDVHSGMLLAHRIDRSENWTAVRLCIADMIGRYGIPDHAIFDNGRHFASKWLTGGTTTRFRFKVRDEDPRGILPMLGVQVHFTTPYHGQAKPIERAFRDLCEDIAKHPANAGAYTGNRPDAKPENYASKAIPIETFRALVVQEIERHNQRPGRRSAMARGRSLAETFNASLEAPTTAVRRASEAQRRMLLLAAEGVMASKRTGEVQLGENRYWSEPMADLAGKRVVVRFDPQDLTLPVAIYTLDGRYVCDAECIAQTGFLDMDAAREHGRTKRAWLKGQRDMLDAERRMSIGDVAALLPTPDPIKTPEAKVIRLVANGLPQIVEETERGPEPEAMGGADGLAKLERLFGGGEVIPFRDQSGAG